MTERLYYTDPSLTTFEATITAVEPSDSGVEVCLDRSAFYPTSGGQLSDRGTLGAASIIDVYENNTGDVVHLLDRKPGEIGDKVSAAVDHPRRLRHRQQHTAQHVLSQVLIRLFDADTVSVHLGEEYGAVEITHESFSEDDLRRAESEANLIVRDNLPVSIRFVSGEEAADLPLRKIPDREGTIRLIQIGELDYSACGGTHCHTTLEVGLIKILNATKQRGNLLVTFLAGVQAVEDYQQRFIVSEQLARDLTCHVGDLPAKFAKLSEETKSQRQQIAALQKELLPIRARSLAAEAQTVGSIPFVSAGINDLDPKTASQLAALVSEQINGVVLCLVEDRLLISTARDDSPNAREITKALCDTFSLRGGGSPTAAQIGGADPSQFNAYCESVREMLARV